jgi:hypothetical protein
MQHGGHPTFRKPRVFCHVFRNQCHGSSIPSTLTGLRSDLSAIYCFVGFIRAGQCDADRDWTKNLFDSGTLTPIIKKLEEKQFLKRVAVKEDERMKKVVLLEKALLAKDKIIAIPFELACSLGLDPDDLVAIHQLCQRFLNGLEQPQHVSRDT